jgi:hypothetical protein
MKKMTDTERIEVMRKVRENIEYGMDDYICWAIVRAANKEWIGLGRTQTALFFFPELMKYKPSEIENEHDVYDWGWFGYPAEPRNRRRRLEVIDAMTDEIELKITY